MEARELRIGNLIYWDIPEKENVIHTVIGIVNGKPKTEPASLGTLIEEYKPIPLTEEWLLNCKSNSIFNNGFEYKKTSTGRFEIYVGISLITVIEFVHELQNLNFALLGEDVIFSEY